MKLYLRTVGSPENPGLVCLHGFMGSGTDFMHLAEKLAAHFYVILPDLPGHGQSTGFCPTKTWSIPFCAEAVAEAIREYAPLNLLGYSLGGRIALWLTLREPHLVKRLVIESALPGISGVRLRQERSAHDDALARQIKGQPLELFLREWYDQPLFAGISGHPDFEAMLARRLNGRPRLLARALSEMSSGRMPDMWPKLASINSPTLLINGALDTKYAAVCERMQKENPSFIRKASMDAGHNVHLVQPEWFARNIINFFKAED